MSHSMTHPRGCEAIPKAHLRKAFSALLRRWEQGDVCSQETDSGCELEESEFCSIHGAVKEFLHLQDGPAAGVPHLPGVQEASCHKQGDATCESAESEAVENGLCSSDGSVREPLGPKATSAPGNTKRRIVRRFPGECRANPVATREGTVSPPKDRIGRCGAVSWCLQDSLCSAPAHRWLNQQPQLPPSLCTSPAAACPHPCVPGCPHPCVPAPVSRLLAPWLPAECVAHWLRAPSCAPWPLAEHIAGPALVVAASSSFLLQASGSGPIPCLCWCWLCSCCWCWLWRWPWLCSQPHSFQSHLQLRSWFWPVPLAGLATMGSATTSPGIPAPGSRVRNGALSSGPPWPLSGMSTWVHVLGDSQCVYLADHKFVSQSCSNERPYLCSKAQAAL